MVVGIPKEIKILENRVSITPENAAKIIALGSSVLIETGAGIGSGYSDELYSEVGAQIVSTAKEVYDNAHLILKVKEPLPEEYSFIQKNQIVFTYFHFASNQGLIDAMLASGAICVAYETVTNDAGKLPLLEPMSRIAGRLSVQEGVRYLSKLLGGKGKLPGGIPGSANSKALIIGGGIVGFEAATVAIGMGMDVTLLDTNLDRLIEIKDLFEDKIETRVSSEEVIREEVKTADLIVGAVLIPGGKAPKLIRKEHLALMEPKTVLVDVAIDQGGCMETSKATTHNNPIYEVDGIIHYAVANMPGIVPATASQALSNATFPFLKLIVENGLGHACTMNKHLGNGLNIVKGEIILKALK